VTKRRIVSIPIDMYKSTHEAVSYRNPDFRSSKDSPGIISSIFARGIVCAKEQLA